MNAFCENVRGGRVAICEIEIFTEYFVGFLSRVLAGYSIEYIVGLYDE